MGKENKKHRGTTTQEGGGVAEQEIAPLWSRRAWATWRTEEEDV